MTSDSELLHIELRVSMQILDERAPPFRKVPFLMSVCTGVIDGLERGARSSAHSLLSGNKRPDTLIHLLLNGILVPI